MGFLVLSIGLITLGIAIARARVWQDMSSLPLITGIVWAAWFPLVMADNVLHNNFSDVAQILFALLWMVIGVALPRQSQTKWEHNSIR